MVLRRLFTLFSVFSLVLCVALAAVWVRSHRHRDLVVYNHPLYAHNGELWRVNCFVLGWQDGILRFTLYHYWGNFPLGWSVHLEVDGRFYGSLLLPPEHRLGFSYTFSLNSGGPHRDWTAPIALLCLLTAVLPIWWIARGFQGRVASPGFCRCCGYDLRATPGGCPECGTAVVAM